MFSTALPRREAGQDVLPVCLGHENPHRLVSLWDMVLAKGEQVLAIWPNIKNLSLGFEMGGEDPITPEEARDCLSSTIQLCREIGWTDLANQASRLLRRAEAGEAGEPMKLLTEDFIEALEHKAHDLQVLVIEERDNDLFKDAAKHLCGSSLQKELAIPEDELNLGGRALSVGLSTAAVSHAMRAIEASLHVLTRDLGIEFTGSLPELQDWANLTDKLKKEIDIQEKNPRSPQKAERLKHLSELLLPADCFRLAWRNHVAHARVKYEGQEARDVLRDVAVYLRKLSAAL
jgi:hypothetical protein